MGHVLTQAQKTLAGTGTPALTAVNRLDPRTRILGVCVFGVVVVALSSLGALTAALAVSVAFLLVSRLPILPTVKRMAAMDGFIIFMLVLFPFTVPGDTMFTIWGFDATWQGLGQAVEIALTANAVILALMTLVGSMEPVTMGHALYRLRCPEKLVHLMMFTIRYIEVLREEYLRLRAAMKVRAFRPSTSWHTYRTFGYLVGMILVRAIERSERILAAMKCRGFSGRIMLLQDFAYTRRDAVFGVVLIIVCAALFRLDATWP
ncbi:cobalt ECF transporter T component CbiQ [Sagittula stellata]|uniref:Cobalt transport protein n=1 Tax=Sagittula stellata (strain ATCC 700073 / DSM 11524 / E-37) TaxID=388399 RepID=A3K9F4_SAGS3|nr:cobalt ECF transporter T component CbiQ [Sagittula stellata]EBA06098.1 Cobalt transport protein [Sagittula stellata E-37]